MSKVQLTVDQVYQLAHACLVANGCDEANADAVAATITAAERDGCPGHGLIRLPGYIATLRSGKVDGTARPTISRPLPAVVKVDGHGGFAPLALNMSREDLIDAAKGQGVAVAALSRVHHFAALWIEVEALAEAGLCAMACTAYMPAMAPAGGTKAIFGTNPFAFGWPRKDAPPMVFDMAAASMAKGEILVAAREGYPVPTGTGLDKTGTPTTDPNAILDGGMILPFGGYKGSNIAMMVELLAAGLVGEHFSYEAAQHDNKDGGPPRGGEFLLAIDPSKIAGPGWLDHSEGFFETYLGIDGARLPGARRHANRKDGARTVEIPGDHHAKILDLTKGA